MIITHKLNFSFAIVLDCLFRKEFPYVVNVFGKEKNHCKDYIKKVQTELKVN
jgi:hypothetical protein